jgi:hypothetical protein
MIKVAVGAILDLVAIILQTHNLYIPKVDNVLVTIEVIALCLVSPLHLASI